MTAASPRHAVFALSGSALAAAKELEAELRRELQSVAVKNAGNLAEIGDSWQALYQGLIARLAVENPQLLHATGLTSPAVQVFEGVQTFARAYAEYPQIFASPEKTPRYFMYAPIDYKGAHFVPADSKPLTGKTLERVDDLLFAGGWLGNAPLIGINKSGIATPPDYTSPSKSDLRQAFSHLPNDRVCFLAAGRSLEIVKDYRARTLEWKEKVERANTAIEAATAAQKDLILAQLPPGEDVRISASYSYNSGGGQATLLLSIRRAGKVDFIKSGASVPVPSSAAYNIAPYHGGDVVVTARHDTPEGRALAPLIDAIPATPSLHDYPTLFANYAVVQDDIGKMLGVNGVVPQAVCVEGVEVLLYNAAPKDKRKPFCPPDAQPIPAEVYEWLRSDEGDRNMRVTPPPRPPQVADALAYMQKIGKPAAAPKRPRT